MHIDKHGNLIHTYTFKLDLSKLDDRLVYEYIAYHLSRSPCSFKDFIICLILRRLYLDDNFFEIRDSLINEYREENKQ